MLQGMSPLPRHATPSTRCIAAWSRSARAMAGFRSIVIFVIVGALGAGLGHPAMPAAVVAIAEGFGVWMDIAVSGSCGRITGGRGFRRSRGRRLREVAVVPDLCIDGGGGADQNGCGQTVNQHFSEHRYAPSMLMSI